MNPFYRSAIAATTLGALVVKAYDDGKTSSPPANVIGAMLSVGSSATTSSIVISTATIAIANTITGAVYETWFGQRAGAVDPPST
jgi:hypothetical protein